MQVKGGQLPVGSAAVAVAAVALAAAGVMARDRARHPDE